jgi:hypothetical protein
LLIASRADVCTKLSTLFTVLFTVVRPKARHNHPMIVRGFETADGRTVEHGRFGGYPKVGDLKAERQLADVDLDPFEALDSAARPVLAVRARVELRVPQR